jgi:mono/diheme cytochrome c family protein
MKYLSIMLALSLAAVACTTTSDPMEDYEALSPTRMPPAPAVQSGPATAQDPEVLEHGRYLVELIGCAVCHTNGALIGEPQFDEWLSGSDIGIAHSNPMNGDNPGVVFPSNITPDPNTGIGRWSDEEIMAAIRGGRDHHGGRLIQAMPWLVYSMLSDEDTRDIVAYLRSLPPVEHEVPDNVTPGLKTNERFVHFGVYRSRR